MKFKSISFYLGLFCLPISILAFINILYSSYFDYFLSFDAYLITLFISLASGLSFYFYGKDANRKINFIEQLVLIIFVYLFLGLLIALPFYLSNLKINFLSAYFESISGLTGTGFSTLTNIKYLDPTLILWRSSSQWIGGLYFLIFLILLFSNKSFNFKMTDITYSGDSNYNSEENIKNNILKFFIFYSILSFIFFVLLNLSGIRLFNSLNFGMTLVSGGGFLPTDNLGQIVNTNLKKIMLIVLLMISLLNFFLLFNLFNKKVLVKSHNEDFYIITAALILIFLVIFNELNSLDLIISILSSLANSGISLLSLILILVYIFYLLQLLEDLNFKFFRGKVSKILYFIKSNLIRNN